MLTYARCRNCGTTALVSDAVAELSDGPGCPACGEVMIVYLDGESD